QAAGPSPIRTGERVVLAENPRGDVRQHGAGLRAGDPAREKPARLLGAVHHHPHRLGRRGDPLRAVDDAGGGHGAVGDQAGDVTDQGLGLGGRAHEVVDHLAPGVVAGRRARPGQPPADRGRELPVDRGAQSQLRRRRHEHPQNQSRVASASITLRPFGPASLETNAKVSTRPLRSVSTPASALMLVSEPVLARNQPAGPWLVDASVNRSPSVPLPAAIGSRSSRARSEGWSGPAAACSTPSRVLAVSRSSTESPLESSSAAPAVSTWAVLNRLVTASAEPAKLRGRLIAAATSRAMHSASTLSEWSIISDRRWTNGADWTTASWRAPDGAVVIVTAAGSRPSALASSRPASSAGVRDRLELTVVGWMRPASIITDSIGAMSPLSTSAGSQPWAIIGPVNAEVSTCTAVGVTPLRRICSTRSLMRAAPRYQVSCPGGTADNTGSPAPTSTTGPWAFWLPATTRVLIRACRSNVSRAAAAVNTLLVDAGTNGMASATCHSSFPVMASVIRPPNRPRLGSPATGASAALTPGPLGNSAVSLTGTMPGLTVGACGGGIGARALPAPCPVVVKNVAATTTAATNASTPNPMNTGVDFCQRVRAITLLTV